MTCDDYRALLIDPRPDLPDSAIWLRLFRHIPGLENKETAEFLQRNLWTLRSAGTMIRYTRAGIRLQPLLIPLEGGDPDEPTGEWESEEFFKQLKRDILGPYTAEITQLLMQAMEG